jgi:RimJ/RimL family protein N-acetyltransferase
MKAGTILRTFRARDGRQVTLRTPRWEDLDDMLEFINSLVEEEAMIIMNQKQTREQETDWLAKTLVDLEKDKHMMVVAEVEGKMVGNCGLGPRYGSWNHVGNLGIAIMEGYREVGIGQEMMKELESHAPRLGVEIIYLDVLAINDRARHVYRKLGYNEVGTLPRGIKYKGEYVDSIMMAKEL